MQRKDEGAPTAPGLLALFGGHVEKGETNHRALVRELKEETSIKAELAFRPIGEFAIQENGHKKFYVFEADIADLHFEFFEGAGAEAYAVADVLKRSDIAESAKLAVELLEDG